MYSFVNRKVSNGKVIGVWAVTLVLLFALACGGAAAPAQEPPAAPAVQPAAPVAMPADTPEPQEPPEISRPLTIVTFAEEQHLDYMDGNSGAGGEHFRNSFTDPLTQRITGSSELMGLAAESWEAVDGNAGHWQFNIREGIEFHNGETFDANAAATDINFIKMPERGMIYSESLGGRMKLPRSTITLLTWSATPPVPWLPPACGSPTSPPPSGTPTPRRRTGGACS